MRKLTKEEYKELTQVFVNAFPTGDRLTKMFQFSFGKNLEAIIEGASLENKIFNLIREFEAKDEVLELIEGARKENQTNESLRVFEERWKENIAQYFSDFEEDQKNLDVKNKGNEEGLFRLQSSFKQLFNLPPKIKSSAKKEMVKTKSVLWFLGFLTVVISGYFLISLYFAKISTPYIDRDKNEFGNNSNSDPRDPCILSSLNNLCKDWDSDGNISKNPDFDCSELVDDQNSYSVISSQTLILRSQEELDNCLIKIPKGNIENIDLSGSYMSINGDYRVLGSDIEDLSALESWHDKLKRLYLNNTQVKSLIKLKEFTGLVELRLSGTLVTDIDTLESLTNLEILYLNDLPISNRDIEVLKYLDNLEELQSLKILI